MEVKYLINLHVQDQPCYSWRSEPGKPFDIQRIKIEETRPQQELNLKETIKDNPILSKAKTNIDQFDKDSEWEFQYMGSWDENYTAKFLAKTQKERKRIGTKMIFQVVYQRIEDNIIYDFKIRFFDTSITKIHWTRTDVISRLKNLGHEQLFEINT